MTWVPNLTLPFVYSWPGYEPSVLLPHTLRKRESYIYPSVIRQHPERLIQCGVHFFCCSFEETSAAYIGMSATLQQRGKVQFTSNEQCVTSEDNLLVAIFHEVAYAVLSMTRSMECCYFDPVADCKGVLMAGRF